MTEPKPEKPEAAADKPASPSEDKPSDTPAKDTPAKPTLPNQPNVTGRFIKLMVLATVVMFTFWMGWQYLAPKEGGDFYVREGDIRLSDGLYDDAIASFDEALTVTPDHRGALMGRAIAFMQSDRPAEAEAELKYLIDFLTRTLADDDLTGQGALAAAHANLGILYDRQGKHEEALGQYLAALSEDQEAVEGPGVIEKILHNVPKWSSVRDRAEYLYKQFQLPAEDRVLRVPELDDAQRMHKP